MTSSATQTEGQGLRQRLARWLAPRVELVAAAVLVAAGCVLILAINRWHLGAPQVFLCRGMVCDRPVTTPAELEELLAPR